MHIQHCSCCALYTGETGPVATVDARSPNSRALADRLSGVTLTARPVFQTEADSSGAWCVVLQDSDVVEYNAAQAPSPVDQDPNTCRSIEHSQVMTRPLVASVSRVTQTVCFRPRHVLSQPIMFATPSSPPLRGPFNPPTFGTIVQQFDGRVKDRVGNVDPRALFQADKAVESLTRTFMVDHYTGPPIYMDRGRLDLSSSTIRLPAQQQYNLLLKLRAFQLERASIHGNNSLVLEVAELSIQSLGEDPSSRQSVAYRVKTVSVKLMPTFPADHVLQHPSDCMMDRLCYGRHLVHVSALRPFTDTFSFQKNYDQLAVDCGCLQGSDFGWHYTDLEDADLDGFSLEVCVEFESKTSRGWQPVRRAVYKLDVQGDTFGRIEPRGQTPLFKMTGGACGLLTTKLLPDKGLRVSVLFSDDDFESPAVPCPSRIIPQVCQH